MLSLFLLWWCLRLEWYWVSRLFQRICVSLVIFLIFRVQLVFKYFGIKLSLYFWRYFLTAKSIFSSHHNVWLNLARENFLTAPVCVVVKSIFGLFCFLWRWQKEKNNRFFYLELSESNNELKKGEEESTNDFCILRGAISITIFRLT